MLRSGNQPVASQNRNTQVAGRGHNDPVVQLGHVVNPGGGQGDVGIHRGNLLFRLRDTVVTSSSRGRSMRPASDKYSTSIKVMADR